MHKIKLNKLAKYLKRSLLMTVMVAMVISVAGCGTANKNTAENKAETENNDAAESVNVEPHKIRFTMENGGEFVIETHPEYAPKTCENFVNLVNEGFYDGLTFHRVLDDFVAQGGDPKGNGTGGSEKTVVGEFAQNGYKQNTLSHTRGVVSMARSQAKNSASSQFFICYGDQTQLDGAYAAFGVVVEGMEVVDKFLNVKRDSAGMPETPIVISKAEVIE